MQRVLLSVGTNLGNRTDNLSEAIRQISFHIGLITTVSSVYETLPWGFSSQNNFLNIALEVETQQRAVEVLENALLIEKTMGRVRTIDAGYSSRIIDIDILFFSNEIHHEPNLVIPHPHIASRKFVLEPLYEIAPNFIHPVLQKTIHQLLSKCTDKTEIWNLGSL